MPQLPIVQPNRPQPFEELILVGFRVAANHEGPQFYTLLAVGGENERPLTANGRIIFFTRPQLAAKSLAFDTSLARLGPAPEDLETFCDVAEALHRVTSQNKDPDESSSIVCWCWMTWCAR